MWRLLGATRCGVVSIGELLPRLPDVALASYAPDARRRVAFGRRVPSDRTPPAMPLVLNLLLGLGLVAAVGASVQLWRVHLENARRDDMQALAARRGWALTVTEEQLGRAGTLRIVPRGGHPWMVEARPKGAAGGPVTLYEAEAPRWAEGTLVMVAVPVREEHGRVDLQILRHLDRGDGEGTAECLRPLSAPVGVTALAHGDPWRRADLAALALALGHWSPVASGARGLPVLILSPRGLQLRLDLPLRRPEQMERFLDLALELSRLIGP